MIPRLLVLFLGLCYCRLVMKRKSFAIAYNPNIDRASYVKNNLEKFLQKYGVEAQILDIDNLKAGYDFVFVIGGDGTILKTARFFSKFSTPVFGINLGRLGFLSQSSEYNLEKSVKKIIEGNFVVEDRVMLEYENSIALNDFVVKGSTTGRTSRFTLKIDDKPVCDYLADGIIISTPTGSTAYGLSAGGPVLFPSLNAFVIVPICPHTLAARPLVIPDNEVITITSCESDKKYVISADGQEYFETSSEITIKKSDCSAKLALLDNTDFYAILRDKLHWGVSPAKI